MTVPFGMASLGTYIATVERGGRVASLGTHTAAAESGGSRDLYIPQGGTLPQIWYDTHKFAAWRLLYH